jgi:hypothetical protein
MRKEISGISVATAILLLAAASLLCTKFGGLDSAAMKLPPAAALSLEGLFYVGIISIWRRRMSPRALGLGVPTLFALRMGIVVAGAITTRAMGESASLSGAAMLSPATAVWATATCLAVAAFYPVRGLVAPAASAGDGVRPRAAPAPAKVLFEALPVNRHPGASAAAEQHHDRERDDTQFHLVESRPSAATSPTPSYAPPAYVEGWATVPSSVLLQQLPAGAKVVAGADGGDSVEVPLALIVSRLREGEVRIPVGELDGVISLPAGGPAAETSVELPLELVVPQVPDEVLELRETPPPWLAVEAELEDIFFAKV